MNDLYLTFKKYFPLVNMMKGTLKNIKYIDFFSKQQDEYSQQTNAFNTVATPARQKNSCFTVFVTLKTINF